MVLPETVASSHPLADAPYVMLATVIAPRLPPPEFETVTVWRGGDWDDRATPVKESDVGESMSTGAGARDRAVTVEAWFMVTAHDPDPLHAPPQPPNRSLPDGDAASVTAVPGLNVALHDPLVSPSLIVHEMPAGDEVIVPLPSPPSPVTVSTGSASNLADTVAGWFIVTEQLPLLLHAPAHPPKRLPFDAAGASETTGPAANVALHVPATACPVIVQLVPAGDDVILSPPLPPTGETVSTGSGWMR